jgi:5-methylcytosine-specific restriction endonuclease McrA
MRYPSEKRYEKEYRQRPEVKQRMKEYLKEYSQRPDVKKKKLENWKKYYQKPGVKERIKIYSKEYYQRNKKRKLEQGRVWEKNNPEKVNEIRKRNYPQQYQRKKELLKEIREAILKKLGGKCIVCGFDKYSCALDMHHTGGKKVKQIQSWEQFRNTDFSKCILLCANCHRAVTYGQLKI